VFVEVKARSSEDFGRPMDAVDARKRRRLIRAGFAWLRMLDMPDVAFRFDVVEVIVAGSDLHIHHIPNAFSLPKPFHY
jgi:putative endonuclease